MLPEARYSSPASLIKLRETFNRCHGYGDLISAWAAAFLVPRASSYMLTGSLYDKVADIVRVHRGFLKFEAYFHLNLWSGGVYFKGLCP